VATRTYPDGIAAALQTAVRATLNSVDVNVAGLGEPDDGLPEHVLAQADVLLWWGHSAHERVDDATVARVHRHVLEGLGLVVLHSGHHSKIFRRLMGTSCDLSWREGDDEELIWTVDPAHPIAQGIDQPIRLGRHEMYGEPFDIPAPDHLVFVSAFTGGEVFRSGCCFLRGAGRIFYFSVGHETNRVYEHPQVRQVLANAIVWARANRRPTRLAAGPTAPTWPDRRA
jgi:trehalose utilization protein